MKKIFILFCAFFMQNAHCEIYNTKVFASVVYKYDDSRFKDIDIFKLNFNQDILVFLNENSYFCKNSLTYIINECDIRHCVFE